MKVIPSALVKELIGRTAGAVGATWRGRNYIRAYNPHPKNPQSAGQQLTRASLSMLVKLWQHFPVQITEAWNAFAAGLQKSGWNCFQQANMHGQRATIWPLLSPSQPMEFPINSVTAGTITTTGCILTVVAGDAVTTHKLEVQIYRKDHPITPAAVTEEMGQAKFSSHNAVLVSAGSVTVTGLVSGQTYEAHVAVYDPATTLLSKSSVVEFITS